jgi:hypothetical protein
MNREGVRTVSILTPSLLWVRRAAMAGTLSGPLKRCVVSRFPESSKDLSSTAIYLNGTLKNVNLFMNARLQQRVIIKFLSSEDIDPVKIHHRLLCASQEEAYVLLSVYEWIRAFKSGRTNLLDDHGLGDLASITSTLNFYHYSVKMNFIAFERLHRRWGFL